MTETFYNTVIKLTMLGLELQPGYVGGHSEVGLST